MFGHIHNVRLMWLESAGPDLMSGLVKIDRADSPDKGGLGAALDASGRAIEALLASALAAGGKVKGFKPHAAAFLGYLISHEAYHHGEIGIELSRCCFPLDKKAAFGMWEWGTRKLLQCALRISNWVKRDAPALSSSFQRRSLCLDGWACREFVPGFRTTARGQHRPSHGWGARLLRWIPAFAGMTTYVCRASYVVRRLRLV